MLDTELLLFMYLTVEALMASVPTKPNEGNTKSDGTAALDP